MCICEHDLMWHDIKGRCNARLWSEVYQWPCHCHAFRRVVPGVVEGANEGDLLGRLDAIHTTLRSILLLVEASIDAAASTDEP